MPDFMWEKVAFKQQLLHRGSLCLEGEVIYRPLLLEQTVVPVKYSLGQSCSQSDVLTTRKSNVKVSEDHYKKLNYWLCKVSDLQVFVKGQKNMHHSLSRIPQTQGKNLSCKPLTHDHSAVITILNQ